MKKLLISVLAICLLLVGTAMAADDFTSPSEIVVEFEENELTQINAGTFNLVYTGDYNLPAEDMDFIIEVIDADENFLD